MASPCGSSCTTTSNGHSHHIHQEGWDSEIEGNFHVFEGTSQQYLDQFVISTRKEPPALNISDAFSGIWQPTTREDNLYASLLKGLHHITSDFPADKRLAFKNTSKSLIPFPYAAWQCDHRGSKPDLPSALPGKGEECFNPLLWWGIPVVFELKAKVRDNPLKGQKEPLVSDRDRDTKRQLAINARNLMAAHMHAFVFVIGIYGSDARIFRFDRAGCIASPTFDYCTRPEIFRSFFWHFVHPAIDAPHAVLGADPTVSRPSPEDLEWANGILLKKTGEKLSEEARSYSRWMEVYNPKTNDCQRFLTVELRYLNPHLFGRATMVWIALKKGADGDKDVDLYAIKDSWRQLSRHDETEYLIHLNEFYADELFGLPEFTIGGDLGAWEQKRLEQCVLGDLPRFTHHRTMSVAIGGMKEVPERSHMRFAMKCVGKTLYSFKSTMELVQAIHDAIIGHQRALQARILHRDVSMGNVLIVDESEGKKYRGLLTDFDYSFMFPTTTEDDGMSERGEASTSDGDDNNGGYSSLDAEDEDGGDISSDNDDEDSADDDGDSEGNANPDDNLEDDDAVSSDRNGEDEGDANSDRNEQDEGDAKPDGSREDESDVKSKTLKERTGTPYFMAVEMLEKPPFAVEHGLHHDLESFYWVLVWAVLRHTDHTHPDPNRGYGQVFSPGNDYACVSAKTTWLRDRAVKISVRNNTPLTWLLREWGRLCFLQTISPLLIHLRALLTYGKVLDLLKKALKMTGWPKDDAAIPFTPPKSLKDPQTLSSAVVSTAGEKRSSTQPQGSSRAFSGKRSKNDAHGSSRASSKRPRRGDHSSSRASSTGLRSGGQGSSRMSSKGSRSGTR
ncbi:hypothetical protein OBBRIDRAFT_785496 [Obba rivulosa]|uniref:Fungal-type protein kinase domain-containing protein n=1 Tax=Obba rivulosa TaxID=1052685 RepID=A0A8E2DFM9_9APHY|nr:hypothetical protein OBBRIDRAFT_785496 [Obba rivulosa]